MIIHCLFRHPFHLNGREEELWHLACDIATESIVDGLPIKSVQLVVSDLRNETYAMLRKGEYATDNKVVYLGTQNDILGASLLWSLAGGDVNALIEAGMPAWQAACDTFNAK
jgi:hypothetical protein